MSNHENGPRVEIEGNIMKGLNESLSKIKELESALVTYMKLAEEVLKQGLSEKDIKIKTILTKRGIGAISESNLFSEIDESLEDLEYATEELKGKLKTD